MGGGFWGYGEWVLKRCAGMGVVVLFRREWHGYFALVFGKFPWFWHRQNDKDCVRRWNPTIARRESENLTTVVLRPLDDL